VYEKIAQNVAQTIFLSQLILNIYHEKSSPKIWATSLLFKKTAQSKQLPNRRKFAKSGHSADELKRFHSCLPYFADMSHLFFFPQIFFSGRNIHLRFSKVRFKHKKRNKKVQNRVARWHIRKPKSTNFGIFWNGNFWYISCHFGTFNAIWYMYFVVIWYILWLYVIFFRFGMFCNKKNLATLVQKCTKLAGGGS
jgi:hypothetical protein